MLLEVAHLTRRFGRKEAVHDLSIQVEPGERLGLVGPDGAGKSTLLRLIAGLLAPTAGRITLNVPRARFGYLSREFSPYPDLTVWENIAFFGEIHGLGEQAIRRHGRHLLARTGLEGAKDCLAGHLSDGVKRKVALVCALLPRTDLLLLDEPATALDPLSRREIWEPIQEAADGGAAVILATPAMAEAACCDRVAVLHQGRLLACDTPAGLLAKFPNPLLELRAPNIDYGQLASAAERFPGALAVHPFGDALHISLNKALTKGEQELLAFACGIPGAEIRPISPTLEDLFIWMLTAAGVAS